MTHTLVSLRRTWRSLESPALPELVGDWEAEFVPPLRRVAPVGLAMVGLPRWYGKRFSTDAGGMTGVNLLRGTSGLTETLPMLVGSDLSRIDDHPVALVRYAADSRKPWPWVVDELRRLDAETLVGMTVVDVPGGRWLGGTPFLLRRR